MPYQTVHTEAELAVEYKGVCVYRTYKDDDIEQPWREYWFVLDPDEGEDDAFDIRTWDGYDYAFDPVVNLCRAVDAGVNLEDL